MIERALKTDYNMCYDSAFLYCLTLEYNGHEDWRLPTLDEYMHNERIVGWFEGRDIWGDFPVIPVRDV